MVLTIVLYGIFNAMIIEKGLLTLLSQNTTDHTLHSLYHCIYINHDDVYCNSFMPKTYLILIYLPSL